LCEIPLPRTGNFGSYFRGSPLDSPKLGNGTEPLRIVIRGFDSTFSIRQVRQSASCISITPTNAPFCSTNSEVNSYTYWGQDDGISFQAKDLNAQEFYANLTQAFTCAVPDNCDCPYQTQACRDAIQAYACESMLNPCNSQGLEQGPTYRTCRNVEYYCGRTFICAGIPRLSCNHTFYTYGIEEVNVVNVPLENLDDPDLNNNGSGLNNGLIALIVVLSVLGLIALIIIGSILYQRSSSLSSVVFDESTDYQQM